MVLNASYVCLHAEGPEKATRRGEWDPIKIPQGKSAYILKLTQCASLLA
jgi:hypothetical protein